MHGCAGAALTLEVVTIALGMNSPDPTKTTAIEGWGRVWTSSPALFLLHFRSNVTVLYAPRLGDIPSPP